MSRKVTQEQVDHLTRAVSKLVAITTTDLNEVRAQLVELSNAVGVLATRHDGLAADVEEVREVQAPTYTLQGADITAAGPTLTDVFVAELDAEPHTQAWEVTGTGAKVFSAGGTSVAAVLDALLKEGNAQGFYDPAILDIHIAYDGAEEGHEEEGAFSGLMTVAG